MEEVQQNVALVVGVTGTAGLDLAEALKKPNALGGPWIVYGLSHSPMPSWFPPSLVDHYLCFDGSESEETNLHLTPVAHEITHLFLQSIHARSDEVSNGMINSIILTNVVNVLTSNPASSKLKHIALQTDIKFYRDPVFDSTDGSRLPNPEMPFREDMDRLPFENFYYDLEDTLLSYASPSLSWSIHRSSVLIGQSPGTAYNTLLTLAIYATICKHEGSPFRYPGTQYTWENFCDVTDTRVLAEQQIWAAVSDTAKNQEFNCTNGDVFTWKSLWKVLGEVFDVEPLGPLDVVDEEYEWVDAWSNDMRSKGEVWEAIVEENQLSQIELEKISDFHGLNKVLHFEFQHVCSMNKSKEFGFFGYGDTLKSIPVLVKRFRDMKIIP